MVSISSTFKVGLGATSAFLNQQKENIKSITGVATFLFGVLAAYHLFHILGGRAISIETQPENPQWVQTANQVALLFASVSLILSAATTRIGAAIISGVVHQIFTTNQLEKAFGPNANFATNPCHPRHVASIAAVIFALPCLTQILYLSGQWTYRKIRPLQDKKHIEATNTHWLTDQKIRLMILFSLITSRPVLHLGNQLVSRILRM